MSKPESAFRENLSYRLSMLHFLMGKRIAEVHGAAGLTTHQWKVLSVVCEFAPLLASGVERWVTLDKSAISRAVKALVEKRLVTRRMRLDDARAVDLMPTAAGRACNRRIARQVTELQSALLTRLKKGDEQRLFATFDALERELRALEENA
jgi:DNA-binding MarR family transcriptional regulator